MGSANINDRSQKGDGDSEIALVVEDSEFLQTTMNGQPYQAAKFAATLRRRLYRGTPGVNPCRNPLTVNSEHLGLMEPQNCDLGSRNVTSFMTPAPHPMQDETFLGEDRAVADPLSNETISLWEDTARRNREIFTELFRPVPTNLVRTKAAYKAGRDPRYRTDSKFLTTDHVLGVRSQCQERACCAWSAFATRQGETGGSTGSPRRGTHREAQYSWPKMCLN